MLESWDLFLFFGVLCIGLIYTDNLEAGVKVLETSFSLLAIPFVVSQFAEFKEKGLNQAFYSFALGLIIASLICITNAIVGFVSDGKADDFFFYNLTSIIDSHPTYLAYYLIAAITFGLFSLHYERRFLPVSVFLLLLTFLYLILMLTGGITAHVSMLFVLAFFLLKFLLETKRRRHWLNLIIIVMMILGLFVFSGMTSSEGGTVRNDSWERLELWEAAILANPSPMLGVGTGDYKGVLNSYFATHDLQQYANANLNAHNQFIEVYFTNGLVGLISLLLMIGRPLFLSTRNGNVLGTLILFPFLIYGMTEVFLGRYQGVVFFAFIHTLFISHYWTVKSQFVLKRA